MPALFNNIEIKSTDKAEKNTKNEKFFSGLTGEKLALIEMEKKGFSLIKKRYKTKYGEIDLIVEDEEKKIIVFVEVKRRKIIYDYENLISKKQWERIYNSAEIFLSENVEKYRDYAIRYDAFICFTNSTNTIHIENILQIDN